MKKDFYKMKLRLWLAKTWISEFILSNLATVATFGPAGDHSFCHVSRVVRTPDKKEVEWADADLIIRVKRREAGDEAE